jgi:hypothetical protein
VVVEARKKMEIIRYKYLQNKSIHEVSHKLNDPPIWYDLLKVKDVYLQGRDISVRDGKNTRFWLDSWLYKEHLYLMVPVLFELCENKEISCSR